MIYCTPLHLSFNFKPMLTHPHNEPSTGSTAAVAQDRDLRNRQFGMSFDAHVESFPVELPSLHVLEHVEAILASNRPKREIDLIKAFFKGPAFFLRADMQGMVYRGDPMG